MAVMSSPYKSAADSPSRQLLWELGCLSISNQQDFYAKLDEESRAREEVHKKALAAAVERHTRVRESAENARRELELRIENERQRREAEERRELRKREEEKAERELSERREEAERLRKAQLLEQKQEEARKVEAEAAARSLREENARKVEAARLEKERSEAAAQKQAAEAREAASRANEARVIAENKRIAPTVATTPAVTSTPTHGEPQTLDPNCVAEHQRYLAIHKNLKDLRNYVASQAKEQDTLKKSVGEMRRQIRKSVGQLTAGQGANKTPLANITETFKLALTISSGPVDASLFLASAPASKSQGANYPSLIIYLLNIFAKAIVAQFISEASLESKQADPIGTIASHIFAMEPYRWNGISLIDILLAKMHVVCPVLFGIWGSEATNEGKLKLGWWREEKGGPFLSDQSHSNRMTGLGRGFAALSLRNYEKSRLTNPYPAYNYWRSFSYIVNVPPSARTSTHCVILRAIIENFEERFLMFFGDAALVALRYAILEYPKGVKQGMGQMALAGLADTMRKDKKIRL